MRDEVGELLDELIADVARSDGRPSAEEIVERLKLIKIKRDEVLGPALAALSPPPPNSPAAFYGQPITATHPRAVIEDRLARKPDYDTDLAEAAARRGESALLDQADDDHSDDEPPTETLGEA